MITVNEYIKDFTGEVKLRLETLDTLILNLADGITTKISWNMPTYSLPSGGVIVRFAVFKKHIGLFPGAEATKVFAQKISSMNFKYSKGGIQFPFSQPLPLDLIKEITQFNMKRAHKKESALREIK